MGSVMRRTSAVFTISRTASAASEKDRARVDSALGSPPLPPVVTPSPIAESSNRETAAEAQGAAGPSPLSKPITTSDVVLPTFSSPIEETQSPTRYIPPPVIDSTAGNLGAFTDVTDDLLQPDSAEDPQAVSVAPVKPPVEPTTPNAPEPAEAAIITEELVDEPTSYFGGPMAESIKDFERVDHADNTTDLSEAVHGNADDISPESHYEQNGEATESHRDVIPTTEEVVENANKIVLPEPDLGYREWTQVEALHHDDAVPVATEPERQEKPQHESEPILIPVPVPNCDMPSYPLNLDSEREVWGGEHDHGTYPSSSVPVVNSSSEDVKRVERSPAPSIRFVDLYHPIFLHLNSKFNPSFSMPFTNPFADPIAPRIRVSQPGLDMSQYVNLGLQPHHLHLLIALIDQNLLIIINKNPLRHIAMVRLLCLYQLSLTTTQILET